MSKSFALIGGDLEVHDRRFTTVSGASKLSQDLALWVQERMGDDPSTPGAGSLLDSDQFIGTLQIQGEVLDDARLELQRALEAYQTNQLSRIRQETVLYSGQTTVTEEETIESIESIEAGFEGTSIILRATVRTLAGTRVTVEAPITEPE